LTTLEEETSDDRETVEGDEVTLDGAWGSKPVNVAGLAPPNTPATQGERKQFC
jgi:hypothetical protein